MAREIKFRAWEKPDATFDGRMWYEVLEYVHTWYARDDYVLMQFTGLRDKNGNEIYEGDIIERESSFGTKENVLVEFGWSGEGRESCYGYGTLCWSDDDVGKDHACHIKVIGNIYENPELISNQ